MELRGVEPRSKRETNTFSTCLAFAWLSGMDRRKATDPYLSFSCASPRSRNSPGGYPNLYCTSCWMPDREQSIRRCPVPVPCTGIKRSFASKLTLREHNCYCQLKELKPGINEPNSHARHACVPVSPAVKTISAPVRCSLCKYTKIGPECKAHNHTGRGMLPFHDIRAYYGQHALLQPG